MSVVLTIGGADKTSIIKSRSLKKKDEANYLADDLRFQIIYHAGQTFRPESNSEVILTIDGTREFGGKIYSVSKEATGNSSVLYTVKCRDYSYDLNRQLVQAQYEDMTVGAIIADLLTNFTDGSFTGTNVVCIIPVSKIVFKRVPLVEAIQRLSDLTNFVWYVDYNKDVHFFEKNTELAPFNLTDTSDNFIFDTLEIENDLSQIRNRVYITGGEIEGDDERLEYLAGDGERLQFPLSNKFANLPTVIVDSVAQDVGVDFLSKEEDYDCFWNFQAQSLRFKTTTVPSDQSGANNITVEAIPLFTLEVRISEETSIAQYGLFEFAKIDKKLVSRDQAIDFAQAQLEAYEDGVIEGEFTTYTPGLRSGQIININSTLLDVNENFIIQSATYTMVSPTRYMWKVKLATLRTIGIVDFLIAALREGDRLIQEDTDTQLHHVVYPRDKVNVGDVVNINTDDYLQEDEVEVGDALTTTFPSGDIVYVLGPKIPDVGVDLRRVFRTGRGKLSNF